jgi:hypothetical protein
MSKSFLDSLWQGEAPESDELPEMPEGGQYLDEWPGFFHTTLIYRMWVEDGVDLDKLRLPYAMRFEYPSGSGQIYYWENSATGKKAANMAAKELKKQFGPNLSYRLELDCSTILGWSSDQNPSEVMGETKSWDIDIVPLSSKKNRHSYHMITLPSLFQTIAITSGMIEKPIFDYEALAAELKSLIDSGKDITDDIQEKYIGTDKVFNEAELWKARMQIWELFGEENPMAYTVGQGKFDTTSDQMILAFGMVYKPQSFWMQITEIMDPRVEGVSKSGNRLRIPAITKIWGPDMAPAVAEKGDIWKGSSEISSNGVEITLPEQWAEIEGVSVDDWLGTVREIQKKFKLGNMKDPAKIAEKVDEDVLVKEYSCTVNEFVDGMQHI